jgi:hypothetical protein
MTDEARQRRIEEALEAHASDEERLRLPWQNDERVFPVVNIELDAVLLNPRSHRIRAQLSSHPRADVVRDAPYSQEAQGIIEEILRDTPRFEEFKANLAAEGQHDAGVITRAGLMINANRRAVALRDLGERYVRVAVLPRDATEEELDQLELRLQVKRDFKEDYTFTNELLFVNDLISGYSLSEERAAEDLGWRVEDVRRAVRMLSMINELRRISAGALNFTDFDEARQALLEIDKSSQELEGTDSAAARRLRDARLTAVLLNVGYRDIRAIDDNFLEDYALPALDEADEGGLVAAHIRSVATTPPTGGVDVQGMDVLGEDESSADASPTRLLEHLAATAADNRVELIGTANRTTTSRENFLSTLRGAVETATQEARADQRSSGRLNAPAELIREADRKLRRAHDAYRDVADREGFDQGNFRLLVRRLIKHVESLRNEIQQRD